jgi:hypothetical protein
LNHGGRPPQIAQLLPVNLRVISPNGQQEKDKKIMTTKTAKTATIANAQTATIATPKSDSKALLTRIEELTQETLDHPQVINKTEAGVSSRVARFLNKEKVFTCASHRFWTGSHVLAYVAKNS